MKKIIVLLAVAIIIVISFIIFSNSATAPEAPRPVVTNFQECLEAGFPIMESYPRQCNSGIQTFTEDIGNTIAKQDLIHLTLPQPNDKIASPLTLAGEARGTWFFEATMPVVLVDWQRFVIGQGYVTAQSDWMTEDFVPFSGQITFSKPQGSDMGFLIVKKDNPSGLPEYDDALEIPVFYN